MCMFNMMLYRHVLPHIIGFELFDTYKADLNFHSISTKICKDMKKENMRIELIEFTMNMYLHTWEENSD